jgi:hypothetical protein
MTASTQHLPEQRLLELGLDPSLEARPQETLHLAACTACAGALEAERALSLELTALPLVEPPDGLATATRRRFVAAHAVRRARQRAWAFAAALAATVLVCVPVVATLLANLGNVAHALASILPRLAVAIVAISAIASKIPLFPVLLLGGLSVAALICGSTVTRLAWATVETRR